MARFYFNTRIGDDVIRDPEGEELRDADHAWDVARAMVRHLIRTEEGTPVLYTAILEVADPDGEIVLELPFSEALIESAGGNGTQH